MYSGSGFARRGSGTQRFRTRLANTLTTAPTAAVRVAISSFATSGSWPRTTEAYATIKRPYSSGCRRPPKCDTIMDVSPCVANALLQPGLLTMTQRRLIFIAGKLEDAAPPHHLTRNPRSFDPLRSSLNFRSTRGVYELARQRSILVGFETFCLKNVPSSNVDAFLFFKDIFLILLEFLVRSHGIFIGGRLSAPLAVVKVLRTLDLRCA